MELISWSVEPEFGELLAVNDPDQQEVFYRSMPQTINISGEVRRLSHDDGSAFAEFDWITGGGRSFSLGDGTINMGDVGEVTPFNFSFTGPGFGTGRLPDRRSDPDGQTTTLNFGADSGAGRTRIARTTVPWRELTEPLPEFLDLECGFSPQTIQAGEQMEFTAGVTNEHAASIQGQVVWRVAETGAEVGRTQIALERPGGNNSTQVSVTEPVTTSHIPPGAEEVDIDAELETVFFAPATASASEASSSNRLTRLS